MKISSSAAVDTWPIVIGGNVVSRAGSMKNSPTLMKSASGRSLPMVSAFTSHALWRMPRTFTHASAVVMPTSTAARGQPLVMAGQ